MQQDENILENWEEELKARILEKEGSISRGEVEAWIIYINAILQAQKEQGSCHCGCDCNLTCPTHED